MPRPTFLCIGAQKCGTTWLADRVRQHPRVTTGRRKELHFFNKEAAYAQGLEWYESQFRRQRGARAVGEFTPNYWHTVGQPGAGHLLGSADRIADAYPDLRLVVCLRDPLDRALSAYFHHMRAGRFAPSFSLRDAVERYPRMRETGLYATQLEAWRERFPAESFLVLVYEEDIRPDGAKKRTVRRVFRHLGVRADVELPGLTDRRNYQSEHFEIRRRHASPLKRRLMEALPERAQNHPRWTIPIAEDDKRRLAADFAPEVERLATLLGRELPWRLDA